MIKGRPGGQLQMFASGEDLKATLTDSLDRVGMGESRESMGEMWNRKEAQSREPAPGGNPQGPGQGVYDSLKEEGWNPPAWSPHQKMNVYHYDDATMIGNGHHRVAAAAALEREGSPVWIPLNHQRS